MNLLQLVLKQMRQRALGTCLTLLSVVLGVALAIAVLVVREGGDQLLGQTSYGYDLIVGKGSPTQLVLNTVYHLDRSPGNIPYSLYETLSHPRHMQAKMAVPVLVGDTYKQRQIVGTLPKMFGYDDDGNRVPEDTRAFQYRPGKRYELADGRMFHPRKFEAIVGSDVPKLAGLKVGDTFEAVHGAPAEGQAEHVHEEEWKVVGVLQPTKTANDRVIFIPLITSIAIGEHLEGMAAQSMIRAASEGRPMPGRAVPAPAPIPAPAPAPAAKEAGEHDDHDHKDGVVHEQEAKDRKHPAESLLAEPAPAGKKDDHADHDHAHDEKPATTKADAHADHDHDHDHAHAGETAPAATTAAAGKADDHADHDHAHDEKLPATSATKADDDHAGHDHGDDHQHEGVAHEHESYTIAADGTIEPKLPKEQWLLSAILVKTREIEVGGRRVSNPLPLKYMIDATGSAVAVMPAQTMSEFFNLVLAGPSLIILLICALVTVVAAVGILVSIYNSVAARKREIAILRALGATKGKVLALICIEAGLIGLVGALLGLVLGHVLAGFGAVKMEQMLGQGFNWMAVGLIEVMYLAGVVFIAVLAGLVPAMKAYRTPVATNLVAS